MDPRCDAPRMRTKTVVQRAHVGPAEAAVLAQADGCWLSSSGVWSVALDKLCQVASFETEDGRAATWLGRWVLSYSVPGKEPTVYVPYAYTSGLVLEACIDYQHPGNIASTDLAQLIHHEPPKLFDYDGDGHAEFLLRGSTSILLDRSDVTAPVLDEERVKEILTYKNGKIEPYKPAVDVVGTAASLEDIRDIDNDGRPDVLFSFGFENGGPPYRVGHSLPDGSFSKTDAVAIAGERAQCTNVASPSLPVLKKDGSIDVHGSQTAMACAAIQGEKPADVQQRLKQGCSTIKKGCASLVSWSSSALFHFR